jgi:hypothetical protein
MRVDEEKMILIDLKGNGKCTFIVDNIGNSCAYCISLNIGNLRENMRFNKNN